MTTQRPIYRILAIGLMLLLAAAVFAISLPFLGALALGVRIAALALIPIAVVAFVVSPRLRAWAVGESKLESEEAAPVSASNLFFHPNHAWARVDAIDRVQVGAGDLIPLVLGRVDAVDLPKTGREVRQGEPLFALHSGTRKVAVRAPISGTVVRTNVALAEAPELVSRSPFGEGWTVTLRPQPSFAREKQALTTAQRAALWLRGEADKVIAYMATPEFAAMQDGGELVGDLHAHIDDEVFAAIKGDLFGDTE